MIKYGVDWCGNRAFGKLISDTEKIYEPKINFLFNQRPFL